MNVTNVNPSSGIEGFLPLIHLAFKQSGGFFTNEGNG